MIHSISIKNFLSFNDEQTLSFVASNKVKDYEEHHVVEMQDGTKLRKLGILYGANASGKSNLIESFEFLSDFWRNNPSNKADEIEFLPFLLNSTSRLNPTSFKLIFYINEVKFSYTLELTQHQVILEKLDYYPGIQPANVFTRTLENDESVIKYGNKISLNENDKKSISSNCLKNMSFFASYGQVNTAIEEIDTVIGWYSNNLLPIITPTTPLDKFTENLIYNDSECKENVLKYLQEADFNISDISTNEQKEPIDDEFIEKVKKIGIPNSEIERLEKEHTITTRTTHFIHTVRENGEEKSFPLRLSSQSEGTQRIYGLSGAFFKALKQNAFLAIDEIESKLHPRLIEYVIENFLRESNESQLLMATHYDNLFDADELLRKDNFWFTEKQDNGSSEIYSLTDFKGLNRISSLQKAYSLGKFGAVPDID